MKQPAIIFIGDQPFIKIEELEIQFEEMSSIESAIACLVSFFFILNIQYPDPLKFVYIFFEHLFEFDEISAHSTSVEKLLAKVMPAVEWKGINKNIFLQRINIQTSFWIFCIKRILKHKFAGEKVYLVLGILVRFFYRWTNTIHIKILIEILGYRTRDLIMRITSSGWRKKKPKRLRAEHEK